MKGLKMILLGIALILLGASAALMSGLQLPTYHNAIYEILSLVCPVFGILLAVWGFFQKEDGGGQDGKEA